MFAPQRRAILHLSSAQRAPHPPLKRAYFSSLRSHKSLEKHSVSRLSYLFAHLHLLSSETFSFLIFFLPLLFSDSSHLCFSFVHIVGSLTSKLPSINCSCMLMACSGRVLGSVNLTRSGTISHYHYLANFVKKQITSSSSSK